MRKRTTFAVHLFIVPLLLLFAGAGADAQMPREQALNECREQYAGGSSRPSGTPNPAYANLPTEQRQTLIRDCVRKLTGQTQK